MSSFFGSATKIFDVKSKMPYSQVQRVFLLVVLAVLASVLLLSLQTSAEFRIGEGGEQLDAIAIPLREECTTSLIQGGTLDNSLEDTVLPPMKEIVADIEQVVVAMVTSAADSRLTAPYLMFSSLAICFVVL